MKKIVKKLKVFVAMSGGVDSSVSAALLKKQGYDVYGVFIKGWYPQGIPCDWRNDRRDAMRVAAKLDIPFYTFDFEKEYKKWVIDYMIREYKAGRTPNPDIMCNKHVKFDAFLKKALKMGADMIATGHYVKIQNSKLKISKDKNKDQSYFLWTLKQEQLKHCLFPVGGYEKTEVRKVAEKFSLPVAKKPDSQGLCFVGEFKLEDFLKKYIKPKPGKIIDEKGKVLGEHKGIHYYTIGQRQGLNLAAGIPYYIVEKDVKKNILVVASGKNEKDFYRKEVKISDVNWILEKQPSVSKKYLARIRYRQPLQKCRIIKISGSKIKVSFVQPQRAVAPGQSLVLYDKNELLGGGIIV
ncbi:MAG: tRNA 2-thiouridine(34) synthase MnmA [Candidatus Pacebacteria bacterium]|nr:tRNA 2-thiouridine(34) synthase MnmA [Candidatus Paceibacterota bacterium]